MLDISKFCMMRPHCPHVSIAKESRMVLVSIRSLMMVLPSIILAEGVLDVVSFLALLWMIIGNGRQLVLDICSQKDRGM